MDTRTAYLLDSIISISKKMVMPRIGLDQSKNFLCAFSLGLAYELNRFAETANPQKSYYPQINFILLVQAILVYSTSQ